MKSVLLFVGIVGFSWLLGCSSEAAEISRTYGEIVLADNPVGYWRLHDSNPAEIVNRADSAHSFAGVVSGTLTLEAAGPRRDEFPLFDADNKAIEFTGESGFVRIKDPGADSPLDFDAGDSITLEAWVSSKPIRSGGFAYIIGKGRTNNPGVPQNNHNYALRLRSAGGSAGLSFLFRSAGLDGDWHRWTSESGVTVGDGWHHVAVTYTFGEKDSARGYVDGEPVSGKWDMGGATDRAPVVDNDEVWIGSSLGGAAGSTFRGMLDEVAIYRSALSAERIRARFRYIEPAAVIDLTRVPDDTVLVDIFESIPDRKSWKFRSPKFVESFVAGGFAFVDVPTKYSPRGVKIDRSNPFLIRALGYVTVPEGESRILVRCRNASRLYMDGKKIAETGFHSISSSAHGKVFEIDTSLAPNIRPLQRGDTETVVMIEGDGNEHLFRFEMIVGGQKHRPELGETGVFISRPDEDFQLLSATIDVPLTDAAWQAFSADQRTILAKLNVSRRREASKQETEYWNWRHDLARRDVAKTDGPTPPRVADDVSINNDIDRFIGRRLQQAGQEPVGLTSDLAFLRRVTLDTTGIVPSPLQIAAFLDDRAPHRRARVIDRLLNDDRWADNWVGYWQDVLAENPNIVNPTLNNTGPFRWWIYESFLDNKPFDRFATELVMMEGSSYFGGPAGFAMATQNDAPMAAKAHIVGQAFMALEMKCARCHDAPYHDFLQRDLFSLAAMLKRSPQGVPATSSIPGGDDAVASLLVEVTLKPGEEVSPQWSFSHIMQDKLPDGVLRQADDPRERLAALITSANNKRFAKVIVNRMWRRYFGYGIVEPIDDWEDATPSHPELLDYLARELMLNDYDLKHVARLILNSHAYQRIPRNREVIRTEKPYLFASPLVRRMSAEQLVDSLFSVCGKPFDAGAICIDIDGARDYTNSLHLGRATRAWQFTSLSNERDRPSLALPFAQPFVTVLETFAWRGSRQDPVSVRDEEPTALQPALLANGILSRRVTRLSDDSALTELALKDQPLEPLIERVYLRILNRQPTGDEQALFVLLLQDGYGSRVVKNAPVPKRRPRLRRNMVSWSNHLDPEATEIKVELEEAVRKGDPPTMKLESGWHERMEDMLWTLINSPEFVFLP